MAMVVKNNMSAVRTMNTLNNNSTALQKSLAKVSSGMKINSAQDDAAGYAISEKMRVRIRSLDQANQNTQNDSSMMKTAEGAVSSTVEIMKALKEKAINAANDSNTDADRATIQKEMNQFIDQIDDNALTSFNGKYLVDGSKNYVGDATKTAFTNQNLAKDTAQDTKLTSLKNRNNESLEISSTDKVTASYVKDGKTYSTTYQVGSSTLEDIFQAMNDLGDVPAFGSAHLSDPDMTIEAAKAKIDTNGTTDMADTAAEAVLMKNIYGLAGSDSSYSDAVKVLGENGEISSSTDTKIDTRKHAFYGDESNDKDNGLAGVIKKSLDSADLKAASNKTATITYTLNYYDDAGKLDTTGHTYTFSTTNTNETKLKDIDSETYNKMLNDVYESVQNLAKNVASKTGDAAERTEAKTTGAALSTILKTYMGASADDADATTAAAKWLKTTAATNGTATAVSAASNSGSAETDVKGANTEIENYALSVLALASGGSVVHDGNTIGLATSKDMTYTADSSEGLTVTAMGKGVQGQISGVNISITDSEGNVKKAANAALDKFGETIRAQNKSDDNALVFQVGAEANVAIKVGLTDMRSEALGLKGSDGQKLSVAT